ncbi:hypothetical protein MEO40_17710 [Dolichospermum sp. ST_sed1]|nr:hypothetical protein [Dolichospermum sp. ST_sed1]
MKTITKDRAIQIAEKHFLTTVEYYLKLSFSHYTKDSIIDGVNYYLYNIPLEYKAKRIEIAKLLKYITFKT